MLEKHKSENLGNLQSEGVFEAYRGTDIKIISDGREFVGKYKIGQKLMNINPFGSAKEVVESKSYEIVGFRDDDAIIMLDSGKAFTTSIDDFEKHYLIEGTPEAREKKTFEDINGEKIESNGKKYLSFFEVGQKIKVREPKGVQKNEILVSKTLTIGGFTDNGEIIIVLDSG